MTTTTDNSILTASEIAPGPPWEPPPPPPPREEMIDTLADRKGNEYGTREELEKMSSAELWEQYRKWREFRDSFITY